MMSVSPRNDLPGDDDWPVSGSIGLDAGSTVVFRMVESGIDSAIRLVINPEYSEHGMKLDASVLRNPQEHDWVCPSRGFDRVLEKDTILLMGWQLIRVHVPYIGTGGIVSYSTRKAVITYSTLAPASITSKIITIANGSTKEVSLNFKLNSDPCMHPADYTWEIWSDDREAIQASISKCSDKHLKVAVKRLKPGEIKVGLKGMPHHKGEEIGAVLTVK